MTWLVIDEETQAVDSVFASEDEAWAYVVRPEICDGVRGAELTVRKYDEVADNE